MKKPWGLVLSLLLLSLSAFAQIPSTLGWHEVPNTWLHPVCPSDSSYYAYYDRCYNVIEAWNGGIADQARNRMIVWGGGHGDYWGNEVYAFNLNSLRMTRLNDPSVPTGAAVSPCEAYPDNTPDSRHSYGGLAHIAHADRMFVFGGGLTCGDLSSSTWTLDLATLQWQGMSPTGDIPRADPGVVSDYDPNTQLVFVNDQMYFYKYEYDANAYTLLSNSPIDYHMTGVIDPGRNLFIMAGGANDSSFGGLRVINIANGSTYQQQDWSSQVTGCSALTAAESPGLAYDPVQKLIVGWAGGNTVYLFNPDTKSCNSVTYPNGPGSAPANGTFGRFRHLKNAGVFVVVNDYEQNVYTLRLAATANADADYNARCSGANIIRCFDFNAAPPSYYVQQSSDNNGMVPVLDTTTYASGGGSLRCDVNPNTAGSDPCGSWHAPFKDDNSVQIGQCQEFYVQWRQRFKDDYYLTHAFSDGQGGSTSWKQIYVDMGNAPSCNVTSPQWTGQTWGVDNSGDSYPCASSCTELEIDQVNKYNYGYPTGYHSCGHFEGFDTAGFLDGIGSPDFMQQGTQHCLYALQGKSGQNCVMYVSGQWMTFQYHVKINQWNAAKNVIEMWMAQEGQPSVLVWSLQDFYLYNDCATGSEANCNGVPKKFGNIWFNSYMTNHQPESGQPTTATWWDELIISRSRIPDPITATPQPPSLLRTTGTGPASVSIAWQSNSAGAESGFKIERCEADSYYCHSQTNNAPAWHQIATVGSGVTTYTDASLGSGQTATYRVRSYNGSGNSAYAGAACHDPSHYANNLCPGTGVAQAGTPANYTLSVTLAGTGSGTVTSSPAGINCGASCSANYSSGTIVVLTTAADGGSEFTGWAGACSGSGSCSVTLDSPKNVTGTFETRGTAPDFSLGPPPPSQSVAAGQSAQFVITINSRNGFGGLVSFACTSGVPPQGSCAFSPPTVTAGANPGNTTLTVQTAARGMALLQAPLRNDYRALLALLLPGIGLSLAPIGGAKPVRSAGTGLLVLLMLLAMLAGCAGSPRRSSTGTPAGSYAVTVTATSGSISHTQTVNLIVQ